jgi:Fe2+ transport system protein FeoA
MRPDNLEGRRADLPLSKKDMRSSHRKHRGLRQFTGWSHRNNPSGQEHEEVAPDTAAVPPGVTLADLKPGECGTIVRLYGSAQTRLRLLEMGLTPGTHVKIIRAAAFGGPLDITVRSYQLSIRREEAATVWLGLREED